MDRCWSFYLAYTANAFTEMKTFDEFIEMGMRKQQRTQKITKKQMNERVSKASAILNNFNPNVKGGAG